MPVPSIQTLAPQDLWPDSAIFAGKIYYDAGYDISLWFEWRAAGGPIHQTPVVPHTPPSELYYHVQPFKSFAWRIDYRLSILYNGQRLDGNWIDFFLPTHRWEPKGPPFLIIRQEEAWLGNTKIWTATTDTPCHMTIWISGGPWKQIHGIHYKRGVAMRHDPTPFFAPKETLEQVEEGDTITHTFELLYTKPGQRKYWYATATIDGETSCSASPQFYQYLQSGKLICSPTTKGVIWNHSLMNIGYGFLIYPNQDFDLYSVRIPLTRGSFASFNKWLTFQIEQNLPVEGNMDIPSDIVLTSGKLLLRAPSIDKLERYAIIFKPSIRLKARTSYWLTIHRSTWPSDDPDDTVYVKHYQPYTLGACYLSNYVAYHVRTDSPYWDRRFTWTYKWYFQLDATPVGKLRIFTQTLPDATKDIPYSTTLVAGGGKGAYSWYLHQGFLPIGLNLNLTTGEISGTPTIPGTLHFAIRLEDGFTTHIADFQIVVNP